MFLYHTLKYGWLDLLINECKCALMIFIRCLEGFVCADIYSGGSCIRMIFALYLVGLRLREFYSLTGGSSVYMHYLVVIVTSTLYLVVFMINID